MADHHLGHRVHIGSTNTVAVQAWFDRFFLPAWREYKLQYFSPEDRPRVKMILLLDRASCHEAFAGRDGGHVAEGVYVAFIAI